MGNMDFFAHKPPSASYIDTGLYGYIEIGAY